ncbi:hypothetical protein MIND_00478200 [Mycena indigotica]|uniref:ATP-dependent DNA helicase n=1 Tax=Mycena indigotica TaxID=2126181 RepID=A0A8H6SVC6_9AGAR|nr:uncharacterized protein MIND_00478200 [Mycena indigotica]KAF7306860.1 hypothetical protein MIND_00478200 [Mycena indigotica]
MDRARAVLKDVFGFPDFRLAQAAVSATLWTCHSSHPNLKAIQNILEGRNSAVILPTGGGKSLVYQASYIPALCFDHGLTLVVSPLLSLMKDQVDALVKRGVAAARMDSTVSMADASQIKADILSGHLKILYVAPERLNNESFIVVNLLAVDEAHCISQWGMSFRPEYLKIARMVQESNVERVLCLTATATPPVVQDMCKAFQIDKESVFQTPVFRPNLSLRVEVAETLYEKLDILVPFLKSRNGPCLIYVTLQKHTDDVGDALMARGIPNVFKYHGGQRADTRRNIQESFMEGHDSICVCTIAFGMGVDKSNIRSVIHLFMPKTLENYSQEIGRAGRDGLPSTCIMFISSLDIPALQGFACGDTCSKRDMEQWLHTVAIKAPSEERVIDFNLFEQSRIYDIRSNVLNLLYAQLELEFGIIRAITPFYSIYNITPRDGNGLKKIMSDDSFDAVTIRANWKATKNGFEVNVVDAALRMKASRNSLARTITLWELDGYIQTTPSQVRARYALLKPFPTTLAELKAIGDKLYADMEKRETDGLAKLEQVLQLVTDDECLARSLSTYFGGENTVPEEGCGNCTFCFQGHGVEFTRKSVNNMDATKLNAILRACGERDDPRLLARMAFGVTSPRLTMLKCSTSHPLFGSMAESDFRALVAAFDVECAKVNYESQEVEKPKPTPKPKAATKRTFSQTSSSRGNGGSSKRGRR